MAGFTEADIEYKNRFSKDRWITNKYYNTMCRDCGKKITQGEQCLWNPQSVGVLCKRCGK
jgi:hypothetical protein